MMDKFVLVITKFVYQLYSYLLLWNFFSIYSIPPEELAVSVCQFVRGFCFTDYLVNFSSTVRQFRFRPRVINLENLVTIADSFLKVLFYNINTVFALSISAMATVIF